MNFFIVEALRIEIPKVKKTNFDLTTKGTFKKASISTRWNLRDIGRNKGRSIMGIVGIIGCTMLLVCAFGLLDTMNSYLDWQFDKINNFEYFLNFMRRLYGDFIFGHSRVRQKLRSGKRKKRLLYTGRPYAGS